MLEILFVIDEILCIISIFALGFFCAVLPKTSIAKYFYILFGVTLLPIGIKFIQDGSLWYEYIWVFLFAIVGILVGIGLFKVNKNLTKEELEEFDKNFGEDARAGGMRRIFRKFSGR